VHSSTRQLDLSPDRRLPRSDKSLGHCGRPSIPSSAQHIRARSRMRCAPRSHPWAVAFDAAGPPRAHRPCFRPSP
jgi:hypothetical protein